MSGAAPTKVDAMLTQDFEMETDGLDVDAERIMLPMLVRAQDEDWDHSAVPSFVLLARIGNIFAGRGNVDTIAALEIDEHVISVAASPSVEWDYGVGSDVEV